MVQVALDAADERNELEVARVGQRELKAPVQRRTCERSSDKQSASAKQQRKLTESRGAENVSALSRASWLTDCDRKADDAASFCVGATD